MDATLTIKPFIMHPETYAEFCEMHVGRRMEHGDTAPALYEWGSFYPLVDAYGVIQGVADTEEDDYLFADVAEDGTLVLCSGNEPGSCVVLERDAAAAGLIEAVAA